MTWVKVDDEMPGHESWIGAPDVALGAWLRAACYSAKRRLDGNLPKQYLRLMTRQARDELLERGRIHPPGDACSDCRYAAVRHDARILDDHYYIHAYLEFNPSSAKIDAERAAARARMATHRSNGNAA